MRKFFVRPADLMPRSISEENETYIARFNVVNPAIVGKSLEEIATMTHLRFIISRIWRGDEVIVPKSTTQLQLDDRLMVVTKKEDASMLEILIGLHVEEPEDWNSEKVDWNALDNKMESRVVVLTKPILNGRRLGSLKIRHTYRVNISRITW